MFNLLRSMAITNLRKNHSLYLPYALATVLVTVVLYITHALSAMPELATLNGGAQMAKTLQFGVIIVQIVSLVIILYANAFVMKNRSKEFGLYGILGLDRKNIQLLSLIELVLFAFVSVTLGIVLGMIFHRISFALLLGLIQYSIGIEYSLQIGSIFYVYFTLAVIFALVFFINATRLYMSRPLELLKEKKKGEKQGRFVAVRAIVGLVMLGTAYTMSQAIESPVKALLYFFLAVLLVVIATYILFDAGSIALLALLQKNKKLFYKPTNFISISNLKFRMRKNAAGLASVCVLSTMVLVTLATTVALQKGTTEKLDQNYPTAYSAIGYIIDQSEVNKYPEIVQQIKAQSKGKLSNERSYLSVLRFGARTEKGFDLTGIHSGDSPAAMLTIISSDEYNRLFGTKYSVGDKEIILGLVKGNVTKVDEVKTWSVVFNATLKVKEMIDASAYKKVMPQLPYVSDNIYVAIVQDPMKFMEPSVGKAMYYSLWDTTTEFSQRDAEFQAYQKVANQYKNGNLLLASKNEAAKELYSFMGSLLFVGALLSIAFFIGAALVIYYKQISEGYEDRDRFVILQKLGIDQKTIKKSINRQVLIVFFLPLVMAFIHTAFAFKMYRKIIELFGVDGSVTLNATMVIGAIFVVVYLVVYQITSRSYFRIIKR
ncbi:FtsX-like permease family protein [uncultured Granulicatella sp.]|uniref:ABC transporter permease n=1 Tax=uncultured Granulicatella sp. TaxID=316089 RepID=UPI0028D56D44|nr:FtsX-like permease family protein [uncultured Granulicatella sp.]